MATNVRHTCARPYVLAFSMVVLSLTPMASWAAEQPFQRFQKQLSDQIPSEQLPTLEMLKRDPTHRFEAKTQQEAEQMCEAFAQDAGLRTCLARSTTYSTQDGTHTDWHCVCR